MHVMKWAVLYSHLNLPKNIWGTFSRTPPFHVREFLFSFKSDIYELSPTSLIIWHIQSFFFRRFLKLFVSISSKWTHLKQFIFYLFSLHIIVSEFHISLCALPNIWKGKLPLANTQVSHSIGKIWFFLPLFLTIISLSYLSKIISNKMIMKITL